MSKKPFFPFSPQLGVFDATNRITAWGTLVFRCMAVCGPSLGHFLDGDVQEGGARTGGGEDGARQR